MVGTAEEVRGCEVEIGGVSGVAGVEVWKEGLVGGGGGYEWGQERRGEREAPEKTGEGQHVLREEGWWEAIELGKREYASVCTQRSH